MNCPRRFSLAAVPIGVALLLAAGCTQSHPEDDDGRGEGAVHLSGALESFNGCDEALAELKATANQHVDDSGFAGIASVFTQEDAAKPADSAAEEKSTAGESEYSGTNVQEAGVEEPDVVKTDGNRIVAMRGGKLYVIDAASAKVTGSIVLSDVTVSDPGHLEGDLLLYGDRALVVLPQTAQTRPQWHDERSAGLPQTTLVLVDLSADPEEVGRYAIEGSYVDARAVGKMSRVVVVSRPRLEFPGDVKTSDLAEASRKVIDESTIEDWLPRYAVDGEEGRIPCGALARPTDYSGSSALTVLSFDVTKKFDDGSPVTIEADGRTVYGAADGLYIANDRQALAGADYETPVMAETEIYRFGIGADGPPEFESSAILPGYLLNQYSMSEWDGYLRVATTRVPQWMTLEDNVEPSSSAVYVLAVGKQSLKQVGSVEDLGVAENIYAVRFEADTGYVVTFRQTDPLYILDLSRPSAPKVTGELEVTGYSAYLHPLPGKQLMGVGQAADESGNTTGAKVSLFDVSDPGKPALADRYQVKNSFADVENDPHAFLYWPDRSLVVLPITQYSGYKPTGVVVLEVGAGTLTRVAVIRHDEAEVGRGISRSLIIGDTLWTISGAGLLSSSMDDYSPVAWVPFG